MLTSVSRRSKAMKISAAAIGCLLSSLAIASGAKAATIVEAGTPGTTGDTALYFDAADVTVVPNGTASPAGIPDRIIAWTGRPDNIDASIGGWTFTASLGLFRMFDGLGQDLVVYEDGGGSDEFDSVNISVSGDGQTFFSINEFFSLPVADLAGDEINTDIRRRRGYDLANAVTALGTSEFSHIRVSYPNRGFDFDAVGVRNFREASVQSAVPEPATWAMMLLGFGFLGASMRSVRRKQKITAYYT